MQRRSISLLTLALFLAPCAAWATCGPTPVLDGAGNSTNFKSATDGSANCFFAHNLVDSTGAKLSPDAAALGDAAANPTTTFFGTDNMLWDATNTVWRRWQADAGTGTAKVDIGGGTLPALVAGSAIIGKVGIDQTTPGTTNAVQPLPGTSGGWTPKLLNALSTTVTTVKASSGKLGFVGCFNPNSLVAYMQVFDTSGTVTLGTTTPVLSLPIYPGTNPQVQDMGFGTNFANAIKVAATTTATGSTAPTTSLDCNAGYN